jgi:tetratricopeptide (TPR) repeat protein
MIVKNESHVIERCIRSFAPLADYYIICDTGSTDNTIEIIKKITKEVGLKGEVLEHPWRNFAHNRTLSLIEGKKRSKADYLLVIDADEVIKYKCGDSYLEVEYIKEDPKITLPNLDKDCYNILSNLGAITYDRLQFMSTRLDWRYESVVHEYAIADNIKSIDRILEFMNMPRVEGARSKDKNKYYKDALALEKGLLDEPHNSRYYFYLAQSYRDAGMHKESKENYTKRLTMPGYDEELNVCYHQLGHCSKMLGNSFDAYSYYYIEGYNRFPHRLECIYEYIKDLRMAGKFFAAYNFGYNALHTPYPKDDHLFILKDIYTHLYKIEIGLCCIELKKFSEAIVYFKYILDFNHRDIDESKKNEFRILIIKICDTIGKRIENIEQVNIKYNLSDLKMSEIMIEIMKLDLVLVGDKKSTSDYYKRLASLNKFKVERKDSLMKSQVNDNSLYLIMDNTKKFDKSSWNIITLKENNDYNTLETLLDLDKTSIKKYLEQFGLNNTYISKFKNIATNLFDIILLGEPEINLLKKIVKLVAPINRIIIITYGNIKNSDEINSIVKDTRHLLVGNLGSSPFMGTAPQLFTTIGLNDLKLGWLEFNDPLLKPMLDSITSLNKKVLV